MRILSALLLAASLAQFSVAQNFPIGSRSITFTDPDRNNRSVPTDIYYPAAAAGANAAVAEGEFPVVVFGHGFAMTVNAYQNWWEHLVPLGFIVALPTTEGGTIFPPPNHGNFGGDLAFLARRLQADNDNASSPFFGHVMQRAALMGHSMGGGASFLGAANNTDIKCVVGLAPAQTNPEASAAAPM
jgi:predicted dienelactone hydrolase